MRAGTLTESIDILKVQVTTNEFGEQFDQYLPAFSTRAEVKSVGGGRVDENNEIFYEYRKVFKVYRYVDVDDFDRIMWKCKQYRILNIDENKPENSKTITCELINQ